MANASRSITITYADPDTSGQPKDVTLELLDYCTSAAIPSASVTVSGPGGYTFSGSPDGAGKLTLGILQPGHYTMTITSAGYLASGSDLLANDGFDV